MGHTPGDQAQGQARGPDGHLPINLRRVRGGDQGDLPDHARQRGIGVFPPPFFLAFIWRRSCSCVLVVVFLMCLLNCFPLPCSSFSCLFQSFSDTKSAFVGREGAREVAICFVHRQTLFLFSQHYIYPSCPETTCASSNYLELVWLELLGISVARTTWN